MSTTSTEFKPKKSVALSGVAAGSTALCTVGNTGNDLYYRGYDILEFAEKAEFEEIAYLIVHGELPNKEELKDKGTQEGVLGTMQTRMELYDMLNYHAYEQKMDELFSKGKAK